MKTVTMPKKESMTIVIPAPVRGNFLPVAVQISLKNQSKRHDKSKTRTKEKNWRKEWA